jgi:REP element-mobilizing transposase RayT
LDRIFHSRPLYFVTFCTYRRRKWLARDDVHQSFVDFATNAHRKFNIAVGRYVIMPEHVHLFACGDASFVLGRWIGQLKQALARARWPDSTEFASVAGGLFRPCFAQR